LKVLKSREKKVVTMDIGPFYAKETVFYNSEGGLYHSRQLRSLVPYRCTYGYDVLVYVGRGLFLDCRSEQQLIEELRRKNISISPVRSVILAESLSSIWPLPTGKAGNG
jgi:hypothetical protein